MLEIEKRIRAAHPDVPHIRMGFIAYRDIGNTNQYQIKGFGTDPSELKAFLDPIRVSGGGDAPEDIAGALKHAVSAGWRAKTRVLCHVADAPCHGTKFHSCHDSYPEGDPTGLDPLDLVRQLANKRVDYYFVRITQWTDQMARMFEDVYKGSQSSAEFRQRELGDDAGKFADFVVDSVSHSVYRAGR